MKYFLFYKAKIYFSVLVCFLLCTASVSHAVTVSKTLLISNGIAYTSGGLAGGGIGDIAVSGSFRLTVTSETGSAKVEDANIEMSPLPMGLSWNKLEGELTGSNIYLSLTLYSAAFIKTEFRGTFDGSHLNLKGFHQEPCADCYSFNFIIEANLVDDTDSDGIPDQTDNCPNVKNRDQLDLDGDRVGDICDHDADGDGYYCPKCNIGSCPRMACFDCDDLNALVHPGAKEVCDSADNNCDGVVDEECECRLNSDCKEGLYCANTEGQCNGPGKCLPRPEICTHVYSPVCGCDGKTYGNECEAAGVGVNAASIGPCEEPECGECTSDSDCLDGTVCNAPEVCLTSCECPMCDVCAGHCVPEVKLCRLNTDCDAAELCQKGPGDCGGQGVCRPIPQGCTKIYDPVCGCDGITYGNSCMASAAGVNVSYKGQCKVDNICNTNNDCPLPSEYCQKNIGDCDGQGTCNVKPDACIEIYMPVCGCDGKTYGNECMAAAAGVSVANEGSCSERQCFDGLDNDHDGLADCQDTDCDGMTDGECRTELPGVCSFGVSICKEGEELCIPDINPGEQQEICNGLDDDCDGKVDEIDTLCSSNVWNLQAGFNFVGWACAERKITAFQLLIKLGGDEYVSSIMRYSPANGTFESAGYAEGSPSGSDFPIESGEGYIIYMKQSLADFSL